MANESLECKNHDQGGKAHENSFETKKIDLKIVNQDKASRLVFFNPLGSSANIWNSLEKKFSGQYELITYEYPGFSGTQYFQVDTIYEYAKLLELELCKLPRKPTILIGYSLGGWVAQQIAINKNIMLDGLILLASSQRVHPHGEVMMQQWKKILLNLGLKEFFKQLALWSFSAKFFVSNPCFFNYFVETLSSRLVNEKVYLDQIELALKHTKEQAIEKISAPTLIVEAKNDILYPSFGAEELFTLIPNSQLVAVSTGHALLQENIDEVFNKLLPFIKEVF